MAAEKKQAPLTGIQQDALDWCRARESFLHVEFRRAQITGPTIYSLIKRKLVEFDSVTCRYRACGVGGTPVAAFRCDQRGQGGAPCTRWCGNEKCPPHGVTGTSEAQGEKR